jgi:hypothetical protein
MMPRSPGNGKIYMKRKSKVRDDRDIVLSSRTNFSEIMIANKVWDDSKKTMFYSTITNAGSARMFYDAISNINLIRSGNFSNATTALVQPHQFSTEEQIDIYRKAFEMEKSKPTDGNMEIRRLDRLFGMK